jgi:SPP1 family predicted phage head-tail adaptor
MLQARGVRRGELDREITFIKEVTTRGDSNQDKIDSWTPIALYPDVYARVKEMAGNEIVIGDQLKFVQKTEFTVVYRTDLSVKNRIVFDGRVYEIISIVETAQRKMYLQILGNYLEGVANPLGGGFAALAFSSGFRI